MMDSCMIINPIAGSSKTAEFPPTQEEDENGKYLFLFKRIRLIYL